MCALRIALTMIVLALPASALASDPGTPMQWLFAFYVMAAVPVTVISVVGMALGSTFKWYQNKGVAVAHGTIATAFYCTGILISLFALKHLPEMFVSILIFGALIWISIKVPLKAHEFQKPHVREKLLKDYP